MVKYATECKTYCHGFFNFLPLQQLHVLIHFVMRSESLLAVTDPLQVASKYVSLQASQVSLAGISW